MKKLKEIEKSSKIEIENVKLRIENYKYIDLHLLKYLSELKRIKDFKVEEKVLLKNETKLLDQIQNKKQEIATSKQQINQYNQDRIEKEKQQSIIGKKYAEFSKKNKKLAKQKEGLSELNLKINSKDIQITDLQKRRQVFDEIIESEDYTNIILTENKKAKVFCNNLSTNTELINKKNTDIRKKQKKLNKSGTLDENLDKIILFGENYINKTNTTDCPLCKTSFDSFEKLIESVKTEKKGALKIVKQQNEISNLEKELSDLLKTKTDLLKSINDIISFEKEKISKELQKGQENKNKLVNSLNDINNVIGSIEYELKDISDFFSSLIENTEVVNETKIDALKKNLQGEISALLGKENSLKKKFKTNENKLLKKENELISDKANLEKNKISLELIQAQEFYQKITSILTEYKISDSQLQKPLIKRKIQADEKELSTKSRSLNTISKNLNLLEKLLQNDKMQIDEPNLESNIFKTETRIKSVEESIEEYKTKFNKYIPNEKINKSVIDRKQVNNRKVLNDLLDIKTNLNEFGIDLELIKENIKRNELEKEIDELNNKLQRLGKSSEKIKAAKMDCMDFIEKGINNYFNKDVINEVYGRIEPHPKLTKIGFSTNFNEGGVPRLLITTDNEEENEKLNPLFFLSAGQLNVLSLSIFLAKAFEYGNETIDTIFMDDPIQNLSDINVLSFIDLLRTLISTHDKQIIISTHDEKFFRLLQNKLPEEHCNTKYFEFESEGKIKKRKDN